MSSPLIIHAGRAVRERILRDGFRYDDFDVVLGAAGLLLVTVAQTAAGGDASAAVLTLFVITIAAAEVVVGLAIIMAVFRARRSASVDDANLLKL